MKSLIDQLVRKIPDKIFYDYPLQDKEKSRRVVKKDNIKYGVDTTKESRDAMIDLLFQIVEDEAGALAIKELYDEVRTLIYNSKGKVEHEKGCHDDVVFSYLFVRYVIAYANSISLFLRTGRKTIVENARTIVGSGIGEIKSIADLNRVERTHEAVDGLSLEEIIDLRERGIDIVKYAKQKMAPQNGGRELHINSSILSTMRK